MIQTGSGHAIDANLPPVEPAGASLITDVAGLAKSITVVISHAGAPHVRPGKSLDFSRTFASIPASRIALCLVRRLLYPGARSLMKRIILTTLVLSTAAACTSKSTPTREQYDDTAQAIASTTATGSSGSGSGSGGGDVASMSDSVTIAQGTMPSGFSLMGDGHFHGTRLGVDYNYAITCKSITGAVGLCGPTADQATVEVAWSGNLDTANVDASVTRNGSWSIVGLQSDTATFNGDSSFTFDATLTSIFRPGVTATYSFDASASYKAIRISTQQRQIIDGAASFDLSAHAQVTGTAKNDSEASFDVHAAITFHADHTADLVLDATQHYSLNLNTGVVIRVGQ